MFRRFQKIALASIIAGLVILMSPSLVGSEDLRLYWPFQQEETTPVLCLVMARSVVGTAINTVNVGQAPRTGQVMSVARV